MVIHDFHIYNHQPQREHLINLRPGFNRRLLNTEQVTKINVYGLKKLDGQGARQRIELKDIGIQTKG